MTREDWKELDQDTQKRLATRVVCEFRRVHGYIPKEWMNA